MFDFMKPFRHACPYNSSLKGHSPTNMAAVLNFYTKKEAQTYAKEIGWRQHCVTRLVNRFCRVWGLRFSPLSDDFLADPGFSPDSPTHVGYKPITREQPTAAEMRRYIDCAAFWKDIT